MPASKALKHKEQNRHRFLTFSERLAQVSVDAVHRIIRTSEEEGANASKFQECLNKWRDEDRSLAFREFHAEIEGKSKNYMMVVHYMDDIIESLKKHLPVPNSLALKALCELLVALCADLRSDVYPHFVDIFQILTKLLRTKELERMECIFNAASMLFKYLWRCMVADMDTIFTLYSPLVCGEHPAHIATFAAESFSFLLRKAALKENICERLFTLLDAGEKAVQGVAKTLFYVLKGTKGNFHSCTEKFLPNILAAFGTSCSTDPVKVFKCVNATVDLLTGHIEEDNAHIFWDILLRTIREPNGARLDLLFQLFNTWCSFKAGILIIEPNKLINVLQEFLNVGMECQVADAFLELSGTVLLAGASYISSSLKEALLKGITVCDDFDWDMMLNFWCKLFSLVKSSSFGLQVMLKYCLKKAQDQKIRLRVFSLMASYIIDQHDQPPDAESLASFHPVALDFGPVSREKTMTKIQDILCEILQDSETNHAMLWCAAVVAQHLKPVAGSLAKILHKLCKKHIKSITLTTANNQEILALSRMLLQALIVVEKGDNASLLTASESRVFCKRLLKNHAFDPNSLFMVDILLDQVAEVASLLGPGLIEALYLNLSSHDSAIRKFSLRILDKVHNDMVVFKTCLRVEETPATVQDYRTKVLHLSKLGKVKNADSKIACAVFRYIVSNFYINFSMYWPCVQEVLLSCLPDDRSDPLWDLLQTLLRDASANCQASSVAMNSGEQKQEIPNFDQTSHDLFFENGVKVTLDNQKNTRVDHYNHRLLLLETLVSVTHTEMLESHNRPFVTLFFEYLEKEHYMVDKLHAPFQNLTAESNANTERAQTHGISKKFALKTLSAFLRVFGRFRNPSAIRETKRLRSVYEDLLMHEDSDVQTCAIKCIFTYREKHLTSHKEQLLALLDEEKIKDVLVHFAVGEIEPDVRESLIPILFRVMYGRMTSKSGLGAHGRSQVHDRRAIVLRFLSGLTQDEMQAFLLLAIRPISHYVLDVTTPVTSATLTVTDPSKIVPLSRQRGILNTLQEVIQKHANLLSKYMHDYFLKLLLSLHLIYNNLLGMVGGDIDDGPDMAVDKRFSALLRALSKLVHGMINDVMEAWPDKAGFTPAQITSIFSVLVDPHLHKLKHECISDPNSLMRFFDKVASRSHFVPLLAHGTKSSTAYPIHALIEVLSSEKTSPKVCKFVVNIILKVLESDEDAEEKDELVQQMLGNINTDLFDVQNTEASEVGIKIVVKYTKDIMAYFVAKLKDKKKSPGIIQSQLKILNLLGDHIKDSDLSLQMAELLLDNISKMIKLNKRDVASDEHILPALTTLSAIASHVQLIPAVAKLFSCIQSRKCRLMLVEVFNSAVESVNDETGIALRRSASIVKRMNAWDARFIEEVDYDSRLGAFQEFIEWIEGEDVMLLLQNDCIALLALMHTSLFTLYHHCDDLSMRESSSRAIGLVVGIVLNTDMHSAPACRRIIIDGVVLPGIQLGVKSTDENLRHECAGLLVKIAKLSPKGSSLSELTVLCNKSDPDADFFENVQHIQFHRRTRAFKKLSQLIVTSKNPGDLKTCASESTSVVGDTLISYKTVLSYLLPLAVQTLNGQDLSKHLHLRDACLEVVSSVASIMPWPPYLQVLKQNMASISKHSMAIRIVCSILDSFHFDISSVSDDIATQICSVGFESKNKQKSTSSTVEDESSKDAEAKSIYQALILDILPQLNNHLAGKNKSRSERSVERSQPLSDEECTARAPLAVAIVSILRKLPQSVLHSQLSTVLLKIVAFLRHRYCEVRAVASKTVVEMVESLGSEHLFAVLKDLRSGLPKGYQKHVLVHTVNSILKALQTKLSVGDLKKCVNILVSVANDDLFGENEIERGVEKFRSKIPEAKGKSKAYNIYRILAQFVRKESLLTILVPLRKVLDTTREHAKQQIVENLLKEISQGLQENSGMTAEDTLIFLHGVLTESLPGVFSAASPAGVKGSSKKQGARPASCYLLSTEPERYGVKEVKKAQKTNMHLVIEFALQFLNSSLKRQVLSPSNTEHVRMLDPFIDIIKHCLVSAHTKTVSFSTQSLTKLLRFPLPSLNKDASEIIKILLSTLRENSRGSSNDEIAAATFKALSVLGHSSLAKNLTETQLQILLGYAEEVLYEKQRQSHAFNLIQSILNQRAQFAELVEVINKIRDICIQSHDNAAMAHARQVYIYYLTRYALPKSKMMGHLEFILAQLSYEYETGRLSALELVASLVTSFTEKLLKLNAGTMFVPVSAMLVNDDSVQCRKLAAHVIKMLLRKIQVEEKDQLFSFVMHWCGQSDNQLHQQLASILVTCFSEVEGMEFHRHLSKLLPLLSETLTNVVENQDTVETDHISEADHFTFHVLSAFHSLLQNCKLSRDAEWDGEITPMLLLTEKLLLHPHTWVRIAAAQIYGTVFGTWEPEQLIKTSQEQRGNVAECRYLTGDISSVMKRLAFQFCKQIRSPVLDLKLSEQCIKNLVFIVKVLFMMENGKTYEHPAKNDQKTTRNGHLEESRTGLADDDEKLSGKTKDEVSHLLNTLVKAAKNEAAYDIKQTQKRTTVLKFCAAICVSLPDVLPYLGLIMDPVYREMERKISEEDKVACDLKKLAMEVTDIIKSSVGSSAFTSTYARVAKRIMGDRRERKRMNDVKLVSDPVGAAAAKVRRQAKKKIQRKRKIATLRPDYQQKLKRKRRKLVDDSL